MTAPGEVVLRCWCVRKSFGAVEALCGASLEVGRGSAVGVIGENGAGKTTLLRIIAGELLPDSGSVDVSTSVGFVRQHLSVVPELTTMENVVLGAEPTGRFGRVRWGKARQALRELAETTGLEVPLDRPAGSTAVAVQQRTEILGTLFRGAELLLLDEPTTYLSPGEVSQLFETLTGLKERGIAVVFISHKLAEVAQFCDRAFVLRRGETVAELARPFDMTLLGAAMTGGRPEVQRGRPALREEGRTPGLRAAGGRLTVNKGEVVGVAGVADNGQEELFSTVVGTAQDSRFVPVELDGADVTKRGTKERRSLGLRIVPSNVRNGACVPSATLVDNVLGSEVPDELRGRLGTVRRKQAEDYTKWLLHEAGVVASGPGQLAGELSGGNLQRLVVARELLSGGSAIVAHEPTRGLDFSAASQVRERLRNFAASGGTVLLLSSDLDELLEVADAIYVLYRGEFSQRLARAEVSTELVGELMGGQRAERRLAALP